MSMHTKWTKRLQSACNWYLHASGEGHEHARDLRKEGHLGMHAITHPFFVAVDRVERVRVLQILERLACIIVFIVVGEHAPVGRARRRGEHLHA